MYLILAVVFIALVAAFTLGLPAMLVVVKIGAGILVFFFIVAVLGLLSYTNRNR